MITIIFLVIAIGLAILASSEEFSGLSILISIIILIGFVSYGIYAGEFHPLNDLTTLEVKNNYKKYLNSEIRLEFTTILNTELIKKDENDYILVKFILYNGKSISNVSENYKNYLNDAIIAYAWVSEKSYLWNTFLQKRPENFKEAFIQGLSEVPKLYSSSFCKLKVNSDYILLTDIKSDFNTSVLYRGYYFSYRLLNYFATQQISGIIAIIIELLILIIVMSLISMGKFFITFE